MALIFTLFALFSLFYTILENDFPDKTRDSRKIEGRKLVFYHCYCKCNSATPSFWYHHLFKCIFCWNISKLITSKNFAWNAFFPSFFSIAPVDKLKIKLNLQVPQFYCATRVFNLYYNLSQREVNWKANLLFINRIDQW